MTSVDLTPQALTDWLVRQVASLRADGPGDAPVTADRPLGELGLSSRDAVALAGELEELLDRVVPPTIAWEAPTLAGLAELLLGAEPEPDRVIDLDAPPEDVTAGPAVDVDRALAVVGLGCRLPGAAGPHALWQLLQDGVDAVRQVPDGRWDGFVDLDDPALLGVPRTGGFLDDVAGFDAAHFGIPPREADLLDPQHRLLLEVAHEALEHAGMSPDQLRGSRTGVFVGMSVSEYSHLTARHLEDVEGWTVTGSALSLAAGRLSYLLDLRGPSLVLDTACSSSLVALHTACTSLRSGESDVALVAGVNLLLSPVVTAGFALGGALAADGRCKPFSAGADGIGRAEGCGVLVVKRYRDALRDGDRVLALVRGSAVGSDGRSNGLTAPNPRAQEDVLRAAYRDAGVDPSTVDHVEAHGTGTALGDPIELRALAAALGDRPASRPLLVGSVKSNLGHLEAAAGVAGVLKTVLALSHDRLPASLHSAPAAPALADLQGRVEVVAAARAWPRYGGVARAGVSAFGFSGTNAHVVLEQAPPAAAAPSPPGRAVVLCLSGSTEARLRASAAALADWLTGAGQDVELDDVAHTVARQRSAGPVRAAVVGLDRAGLVAELRALAADAPVVQSPGAARGPLLVFSGYGAQWHGMGRALLSSEPVFARVIDDLGPVVRRELGCTLRELLTSPEPLAGVAPTQVALFGVQVGLLALLRALGVTPSGVVGFSLGEVAATVAAGVLDVHEGVRVVVTRARLLDRVDSAGGGAMAVLGVSAEQAECLRDSTKGLADVEVVVHLAADRCTVAGPAEAVDALVARAEADGVSAWRLPVAGAGHTAAVEPVLAELRAALDDLDPSLPVVPFYSSVREDPRDSWGVGSADYWVANARRAVRFAQAVRAAAHDGARCAVEVSAHPIVGGPVAQALRADGRDGTSVLATLRRDEDDRLCLGRTVGGLAAQGDRTALLAWTSGGRLVDLPPTPWAHTRHWVDGQRVERPARPLRTPGGAAAVLGQHLALPEGGRHVWLDASPRVTPDVRGLREVAAAAVLEALQVTPTELRRARLTPTDSDPDQPARHLVELRVTGPGGARLTVHRDEDGWQLVASAELVLPTSPSSLSDPSASTAPGAAQATPGSGRSAAAAPANGADGDLLDRLRGLLARVMGRLPDEIDVDAPLTSIGLDSLTAARARNTVEQAVGRTVPVALLLQGASLRELAEAVTAPEPGEAQVGGPDASGSQTSSAHLPAQASTPQAVVEVPHPRPPQVAPRDPTERFLAGLWREVLGERPLGVTVPFTDCGGDPVGAQRLADGIARRVGQSPDAQALLAASTVERMADLVRGAFEGSGDPLRLLQPGRGRRPLFLFHPAGGPTSVYLPLVDLLDPEQPVWGLERLPDAGTVEAKAARYVEVLRGVQRRGPYRLMGWSLGGLLALEVADQLAAAGERVELLASIDTIQPRVDPDADLPTLLRQRYERFVTHVQQTYGRRLELPDGLEHRDEDEQVAQLLDALTRSGVALPAGVLEHQYTSYVDARVAERYTPRPYAGHMVLYRAQEVEELTTSLDPRYHRTDAALGWDATVPHLEVVPVPGNHISMIDPPHVQVLAHDLRRRLRALDASDAAHAGDAAGAADAGGAADALDAGHPGRAGASSDAAPAAAPAAGSPAEGAAR